MLSYLEGMREVALLAVLVIAAFTELAYGKVYNWLTLPAMVAGLMLNYILGGVGTLSQTLPSAGGMAATARVGATADGACLLDSLLGMGLAGGLFGAFWLLGQFGGADLKLAVAVGALKGWYFALLAIVATALVGGVLALAVLVWKGRLRQGLRDSLLAVVRLRRKPQSEGEESPARLTVPYGLAISVGTMWVWMARMGVF